MYVRSKHVVNFKYMLFWVFQEETFNDEHVRLMFCFQKLAS